MNKAASNGKDVNKRHTGRGLARVRPHRRAKAGTVYLILSSSRGVKSGSL